MYRARIFLIAFLCIFPILFGIPPAGWSAAPKADGSAYTDLGIFAYEAGNYTQALNYFRKALKKEPQNPKYHYLLGKTFFQLKNFEQTKLHYRTAWQITPTLPGLQFSRALLALQTSDFSLATSRFQDLAVKDPSNILVAYYLGVSLYKQKHYQQAVHSLSRPLQAGGRLGNNAAYYTGVCQYHLHEYLKATECLTRAKNKSDSDLIRKNADIWLQVMARQEAEQRPYQLRFKTAIQYDDNVPLDPKNEDIFHNQDDLSWVGLFSGSYIPVRKKHYTLGIGLSQYQESYFDLNQYDISGSLADMYGTLSFFPLTLGMHYLPAYYWMDNESYLRQHTIKPTIQWKISQRLWTHLSYSFTDQTFFADPSLDGYLHEFEGMLTFILYDSKLIVRTGAGGATKFADSKEQDYDRLQMKAGLTWKMPKDFAVKLDGIYTNKEYIHKNTYFHKTRNDRKIQAKISLSKNIYAHIVTVKLSYQYTNNFSNIDYYEYLRNITTLSCHFNF